MAPDGTAYVVYRVVTNPLTPGITQPPGTIAPMHPGDELVDVRVAQFNGLFWNSLGAVNRAPGQVTMRKPTAANAPVITVDRGGDAMVAWQEPDIDGVARIWARRLYGTSQGYVLRGQSRDDRRQAGDRRRRRPVAQLRQLRERRALAFRLGGGPGSPLGDAARVRQHPAGPVHSGAEHFTGPVAIAGAPTIGEPSVSVDDNGDFQAGFTAGGASELVERQPDQTRGESAGPGRGRR